MSEPTLLSQIISILDEIAPKDGDKATKRREGKIIKITGGTCRVEELMAEYPLCWKDWLDTAQGLLDDHRGTYMKGGQS
jgi:hypothetical protein